MTNTYSPHIYAISNLQNRIASSSLSNSGGDSSEHLSKEQLISIFFHDDDESKYQTSTLQYTAPFKATIRICTPPNDQESTVINSSEEFQLYVMTEHLLLFNREHAFKIHFSDILMHGVQQQPQICMYCQLACDPSEKDESQMEEGDDEGFESVCEMIIQLQVQSSALEQIYNQMYQAFSRAAENVPLSSSDMQDDDSNDNSIKFDPKSLDDKLSISTDGWIYNVEEMRRGVLIRDRTEREEDDEDGWEDVEEDEEKNKKLKM